MFQRPFLLKLLILLGVLTACVPLYADDSGDRVQFGRSIVVAEGETAGDLVCIGCSILVEGACQDVVAVGGSVTVNGTVKGDLAVVGGGVSLGENATVNGDVATMGGRLSRHPDSVVHGNVSTLSGTPVFLGLALIPLVPIVLIVALVIWLVKPSPPRQQIRTWRPPPAA